MFSTAALIREVIGAQTAKEEGMVMMVNSFIYIVPSVRTALNREHNVEIPTPRRLQSDGRRFGFYRGFGLKGGL